MKKRTWDNPEFNCQYDGVVYAVFTSLGFALWENISYVLNYGLSTALVRAVTAVPGHACFGVFMGIFYGIAKKEERSGYEQNSRIFRILAVLVPAVIHGAYDYVASMNAGTLYFIFFIVVLFVFAFLLVDHASKNDRYI
jgi:RsiW-degrading membrane proteinase PrsW (M82 family)